MTLRHVCTLIVLAATLSGCASSAPIFVEPTAQAIMVEPENNVLLLQSLRGAERRRLQDFIFTASRGRRDALHLEITGSPRLAGQVAHQARAMGVPSHNIDLFGGRADPHGRFAVRIEAIAYQALPPVCPSLSIVGPSVNDNSFDQTLGCSTRNNLAAMINDPRDLIGNEAVVASNGDRAAIPVAAYRTFATGNSNNNQGRGTNSGASSQAAPVGSTSDTMTTTQ